MTARRKSALTGRRRQMFLDVIRQTANVSAACRAINASSWRLYELRKEDEQLRADWDAALEEALDDLEEELRRRAMEGVEKPVYYGGKSCGTVRAYSDQLGMFLLRSRRRQIFGDGEDADKLSAGDRQSQAAEARKHLETALASMAKRLANDNARS